MAELKTKLNDGSVENFLNTIEDGQQRSGSFGLLKMMPEVSGELPKKICCNKKDKLSSLLHIYRCFI